MMRPGDHAEIVKGQARVEPVHDLQNARAHGGDLRVVGDDGVIVDDEINVQLPLCLPFDLVQNLMGNKRVDAVVDLGVDAGKAAARPVIMHHEIVEAENVHVRGHKTRDGAHKRFIRLRAQQRVDGVLHYADARPQNKQRHQKPSPAVDHQPRQPPDHAGKQHRAGRDHVAAAVGSGGDQRGRADLPAELPVKQRHPELQQDRACQHGGGQDGKLHGLRVQDLLNRAFDQLHADHKDHHGHGKAGQVFHPRVAVGVFLVGRPGRQPEAQQRHERA